MVDSPAVAELPPPLSPAPRPLPSLGAPASVQYSVRVPKGITSGQRLKARLEPCRRSSPRPSRLPPPAPPLHYRPPPRPSPLSQVPLPGGDSLFATVPDGLAEGDSFLVENGGPARKGRSAPVAPFTVEEMEYTWSFGGFWDSSTYIDGKLYSPVFTSGQYNWSAPPVSPSTAHHSSGETIALPQASPALPRRQQGAVPGGLPRRPRLGDAADGVDAGCALHAHNPQPEGAVAQRRQRRARSLCIAALRRQQRRPHRPACAADADHQFSVRACDWGWKDELVTLAELRDASSGFVVNGALTVSVKLRAKE